MSSNTYPRQYAQRFRLDLFILFPVSEPAASTITDQEFEDTYSIDRTALDDLSAEALSCLFLFAKKGDEETYEQSRKAMESALFQLPSLEALSDETEAQPDEHQAKLPADKAKVTAP